MINIEVMAQNRVPQRANSIGSICSYSDNITLLNELFRLGLIIDSQISLAAIYQYHQKPLHQRQLQQLSTIIDVYQATSEAAHVVQC